MKLSICEPCRLPFTFECRPGYAKDISKMQKHSQHKQYYVYGICPIISLACTTTRLADFALSLALVAAERSLSMAWQSSGTAATPKARTKLRTSISEERGASLSTSQMRWLSAVAAAELVLGNNIA